MTETIDYKGYCIQINEEEGAESPRTWENMGVMACYHSRYDLGDSAEIHKLKDSSEYGGWSEIEEALKKEMIKKCVSKPFS